MSACEDERLHPVDHQSRLCRLMQADREKVIAGEQRVLGAVVDEVATAMP
jgi:hypothetical protein